jgi:beta-galactosidase
MKRTAMTQQKQNLFALGAAYYPDYISKRPTLTRKVDSGKLEWLSTKDRMQEDFKRMVKQNIHTIRMGEFSWATVEPQRGTWIPDVFMQALDLAHAHSIDVIFCTPTATPPHWLIDEHPDILPITRTGQQIPFGSRRHYDFHHPVYKAESRRISEIFARSFGNHPAVKSWQTDNEFGCHNSVFLFTEYAKKDFQKWLESKYNRDIHQLNEDWFTCFWSQRYSSFSDIGLPLSSWADQNPHMELDFRRFSNEALREFQREQIEIIKTHSPGRPVTHNLMTLFSDLCPWQASLDLDYVGFDHYQMEPEPHPMTSAWQFALMRSLKQRPFVVLEQQPVQVNWQPVNRRFSFDWLLLWGLQSAFQGANGMLYFSWQRMAGGCEQYHDGVVPHDVRIETSQQEKIIKAKNLIFAEFQTHFGFRDQLPEPARDVLCIHDSESLWSHEITSQSTYYSTRKQLDHVAQFCLQHGDGLWFSNSLLHEREKLSNYKLIILPGYAFELTHEERSLLESFRRQGGRVISFPRTAYKHRNNQLSPLPAVFYAEQDFYLEDYGALAEGEIELCQLTGKNVDKTFNGHLWSEKIKIQNPRWSVEAQFSEKSFYAGAPALLKLKESPQHGCHLHVATCPVSTKETFSLIRKTLELPVTAQAQSAELQLASLGYEGRRFISGVHFGKNQTSVVLNEDLKIKKTLSIELSADLEPVMTVLGEATDRAITVAPRSVFLSELERA